MYFVIIMAFALVLSDSMPPEPCNFFRGRPLFDASALWGTIAIVVGQVVIIAIYGLASRFATLRKLDGTLERHDDATDLYGRLQDGLLFVLSAFLVVTNVCTPWARIVREFWRLGQYPLVADLVILAPLGASLIVIWILSYRVESRLKAEALQFSHLQDATDSVPRSGSEIGGETSVHAARTRLAREALDASVHRNKVERSGLIAFMGDKFRHQVLLLAAPMCVIVAAKFVINRYLPEWVPLPRSQLVRDIILNSLLGTVSVLVLVVAPWMLRHIWSTEPLPPGPLRDRFVATCKRIGLRYREILLWHTHGNTVNAAVMGFIPQLRYILVSDALLETMDDDEIEAVFGHEAGHVNHWHLHFFGAFAIVSMYAAGGVMLLLNALGNRQDLNFRIDDSMLQFSALVALMLMWLFGFSWLSRKFERQADLYGVRCITPDISTCVGSCPVHGVARKSGICTSAANIFGRTLVKIADLNGIPREAPSWRHGSIDSRCKLLESFVGSPTSLAKFDRGIVYIKIGLLAAVLIGSMVAVFIYYEPVMAVIRQNSHGAGPRFLRHP